jgi:hypothetical protein
MCASLNKILLLFFLISSCSGGKTIEIIGNVKVMQQPYPEGHVAELSVKNNVVAELKSGRVEVLKEWADKEFYVYEVRIAGGQKGFVFGGDNIRDARAK